MKIRLLIFILIFYTLRMQAQNLVPNPSFENVINPPCSWILSQADFSNAIHDWFMPSNGSSDIFSTLVAPSCYAYCYSTSTASQGSQAPRTGSAYAGINCFGDGCSWIPNYREYLEVRLTSPLIPGQSYEVELYASLADSSFYGVNNLGMYFSDTMITDPANCFVLNYIPQINSIQVISDTINWTRVSGTLTPTSPLEYLIIGNFFSDTNTTTQNNYHSSTQHSYYFIDDVSVKPNEVKNFTNDFDFANRIIVYPTVFNDWFGIKSADNRLLKLKLNLYDVTSRLILAKQFANNTTIRTDELSAGTYFYGIFENDRLVKTGKIVKQ